MKYPWNSTTKVIKYGKIDARLFFPFPNWVIFFLLPPPLPSRGGQLGTNILPCYIEEKK